MGFLKDDLIFESFQVEYSSFVFLFPMKNFCQSEISKKGFVDAFVGNGTFNCKVES